MELQNEFREKQVKQAAAAHAVIVETMRTLHEPFAEGSSAVKAEWRALRGELDTALFGALRQAIRRSLTLLSRAVNGDKGQAPYTLFAVDAQIEGPSVNSYPTMATLTGVVNQAARSVILAAAAVQRLSTVDLSAPAEPVPEDAASSAPAPSVPPPVEESYYKQLFDDDDLLKLVAKIMRAMHRTGAELKKTLTYFEKYRLLWELDKDNFVHKYAKAKHKLADYDADVVRYKQQQADVQAEPVTSTVQFVKVDCSLLRSTLVKHCHQWQSKLLSLLHSNFNAELAEMLAMFASEAATLRVEPTDLGLLDVSNRRVLELREAVFPKVQAQFGPLEDVAETLAKFDAAVTVEEAARLGSARPAFSKFKDGLVDIEKMLLKVRRVALPVVRSSPTPPRSPRLTLSFFLNRRKWE